MTAEGCILVEAIKPFALYEVNAAVNLVATGQAPGHYWMYIVREHGRWALHNYGTLEDRKWLPTIRLVQFHQLNLGFNGRKIGFLIVRR